MRSCKFNRCSAWALAHTQDSGKISFAVQVHGSVVVIVIDDVIATVTTSTVSIWSILLPLALYQMLMSGQREQSVLTNGQGPSK